MSCRFCDPVLLLCACRGHHDLVMPSRKPASRFLILKQTMLSNQACSLASFAHTVRVRKYLTRRAYWLGFVCERQHLNEEVRPMLKHSRERGVRTGAYPTGSHERSTRPLLGAGCLGPESEFESGEPNAQKMEDRPFRLDRIESSRIRGGW